jgi:hypothetical protein
MSLTVISHFLKPGLIFKKTGFKYKKVAFFIPLYFISDIAHGLKEKLLIYPGDVTKKRNDQN